MNQVQHEGHSYVYGDPVWVAPETDPETKIQVQLVDLEGDAKKHGYRVKSETKMGRMLTVH